MRASVSEILLFRKCPRAWHYGKSWQLPESKTGALAIGTAIHSEFEKLLNELIMGKMPKWENYPWLTKIPDITKVINLNLGKRKFASVEKAIEFDFRGHTLLGRPDGLIQSDSGYLLWQIKSVSKNSPTTLEYVGISPHEAVYAAAIEEIGGTRIVGTYLCRYVKTGIPSLLFDTYYHSAELRADILDSVELTLCEMERYEKEAEERIPKHTEKCIDWITGSRCAYFQVCHHRADPSTYLVPTVNRYPEFEDTGDGGSAGGTITEITT